MSGGKSQGGSSQGSSESRSFIAPFQQQALENLFTNAESTFNNLQGGFNQAAGQLGENLNAAQQQATDNLLAIGSGEAPALQRLQQLGSQANPYLNQQIAGLGTDIQNQLQQNLGGIGQGFVSAGQFGGSRQGLAEGLAVQGALQDFSQQAAQLRGDDLTRQAAANQALAGAQLQGNQLAQGGLTNAFNLGLSPYTSQLGFLSQLGDIYGSPTVLGESASRSKGRQGDSFSLGII